MNMVALAWKNLRRRPARSLLTILGVAAAVAAVVSLVGLAQSLETSFLALYTHRGADLVVQRRGGTVQLSKGLPLALADAFRQMQGVKEVVCGLMDMVAFEKQGLFMVIVNGWEADCPVLDRVKVTAGRRLRAGDRRQVMFGASWPQAWESGRGTPWNFTPSLSASSGVFESFSVYENGAVFMLIDELQRQMDRPGQATGLYRAGPIRQATSGHRADWRGKSRPSTRLFAATPCAEFVRSLEADAGDSGHVVGHCRHRARDRRIGVLNTMAMSVSERRQEIGAIRAMGWRKRQVVQLLVAESLLLATAGAAAGTALGLAIISGLSRWHVTAGLVQGDWPPSAVVEGVLLAFLMADG